MKTSNFNIYVFYFDCFATDNINSLIHNIWDSSQNLKSHIYILFYPHSISLMKIAQLQYYHFTKEEMVA